MPSTFREESMAKASIQKRCARAKVVLELIEKFTAERKGLYAELDEHIAAFTSLPAAELAAHGLVVTDAFAKGNTAWGHGPVRRLSLEVLETPVSAKSDSGPAPVKSSEGSRKRKASEKST